MNGRGTAGDELGRRLAAKQARVGVIGLGYVGLPLVRALHGSGLEVLGFDVDPAKVAALAAGESYVDHLGEELWSDLAASPRFGATADFTRLGEPDALVVCVPTPLGPHREPDLSFVLSTAESIGACLRPGQLVVLASTTYPGTTRDVFAPALLGGAPGARGLELGRDVFVAYAPEREDPGRSDPPSNQVPRLVGGLEPRSTELAARLFAHVTERVVEVSSAEAAEAAKIFENVFRSVNIALVNELKVILDAMGLDVWEVVDAAATKPYGFMPFRPGPGLGGHCIPVDPFYLAWKAREVGHPTRFVELAGEINTDMPARVVDRLVHGLNQRHTPIRDARVLVLGLAYKPDVADTRESPSFELIRSLRALGARVDYSDPHVPRTWPARRHDLGMESVELTPERLAASDAVLIATDHSAFDYAAIARHARFVVDTRNAMARFAADMGERLLKA